ncbi:Autophagy-related protein 28 [Colletotrichum sidae]|uniref:Autophagy-related protein 28 n=1 Tax=Colletotrichum sidae TaxID=1347389 RepID=A0A4R8SX75_9PEZI|nr:Autophagy-related protein 28 [Colletotrichum sidae]
MQATNLVLGGDAFDSSNDVSGLDTWSDSGSSTPTGTFYSTATPKSRMMASLDPPVRATARGDVIPVRQPQSSGPQGLRTARSGLQRSLAAFTELKAGEDDYLVAALSQRKKALAYLNKLDCRRMNITAELSNLADDQEEPLAKELRELGAQHESLGQEIRDLEARLVGMRNRHKWLGRKMEDVHNRREAGLSGYRGALKEVEGEITSLLRRPPIDPLDAEVVKVIGQSQPATTGGVTEVLGGEEFLRMIPTRRTLSMAKDWWEAEVVFLQKRKAQVDKDRDALNQGAALWQETTHLVTNFEADMRQSLDGSLASKGKRTPRAQQEAVDCMLSRMDKVIVELGDYLRTAEQKNWNLLICAIGAELEAFRKAEQLLRDSLPPAAKRAVGEVDEPWASSDDLSEAAEKAGARSSPPDSRCGESDNEVPAGLLVSRGEEEQESPAPSEPSTASFRRDSDNEVPPEFLAEHSNEGASD